MNSRKPGQKNVVQRCHRRNPAVSWGSTSYGQVFNRSSRMLHIFRHFLHTIGGSLLPGGLLNLGLLRSLGRPTTSTVASTAMGNVGRAASLFAGSPLDSVLYRRVAGDRRPNSRRNNSTLLREGDIRKSWAAT